MKLRKEYRPKRVISPVSPYVHKRLDGTYWIMSKTYDPPLPAHEMGRGFPVWILSHQGRELFFASREEMAHVADILSRRVLPRPWQLYTRGGYANQHWLSRLHKDWTPWRVREKAAAALWAALD